MAKDGKIWTLFIMLRHSCPVQVSQALMRIPPRWAGDITEIRLRSGRPVSLSTPSGARFVP